MHPLLKRTLIFVALMIAGLVLYVKWFDTRADRYDETVIPYLQRAVPVLSDWRYQQLEPLLSPSARRDFSNPAMQAAYRSFDRLGRYQSMGKPQYMGSTSGSSTDLGEVEIIDYQVDLQFDTGPAMLKVKLLGDGQAYYLHHFSFQSQVFAEEAASVVE